MSGAVSDPRVRALAATGVGIWELDVDGKTTFASDETAAMLGYVPAELVGRPVLDFVEPASMTSTAWSLHQRRVGRGDVRRLRLRGKDGSIVPVLVAAAPIYNGSDFSGSVATVVDLRGRGHASLDGADPPPPPPGEADEGASEGSWTWTVVDDRVKWSQATHSIFGVEPESFPGTFSAFMERVHPDDRAPLEQSYRAAFGDGKPLSAYFRIVRPDGEVRIVHSFAHLMREAGSSLVVRGRVRDVTGNGREGPKLSKRERDVLDLMANGLTVEEIAGRLHVSPHTVRTHVHNAIQRLDAHNRVHAIVVAIRLGHLER